MLSNSEKLERLFDLYEMKMYKTAFRILNDEGQAEDAVQDAFVKVMSCLHKIKDPQALETKYYMLRLIKSTAIDIYRKNKKDWENLLWDSEDFLKNQKVYDDTGILKCESRQMIRTILEMLDQKYRDILELKYYFGLSHRECSRLLGVSEDVIAKRLERAKRMALKMMEDDLDG